MIKLYLDQPFEFLNDVFIVHIEVILFYWFNYQSYCQLSQRSTLLLKKNFAMSKEFAYSRLQLIVMMHITRLPHEKYTTRKVKSVQLFEPSDIKVQEVFSEAKNL